MDRRTFLLSTATAAGAGFALGTFRDEIKSALYPEVDSGAVPVIGMHFRALRGVGWRMAERPNEGKLLQAIVTKAPYGLDGTWFDVDKPSGFVPGQLVSVLSPDGLYRSATIAEVKGSSIRFQQSLSHALAVGSSIFNFYLNDAHPHTPGYFAIADDAAAQLNNPYERWRALGLFGGWDKVGNVVLTENANSDYGNPGGAYHAAAALQVSVSDVLSGVQSREFALGAGDYRLSLPLSFARTTGYGSLMRVDVLAWSPQQRTSVTISTDRFRSLDGVFLAEVPFTLDQDTTVSFSLVIEDGTSIDMTLGYGHILRKSARPLDLSLGTTVLFGDSWINWGSVTERFKTKWYPKAKFVQSGVPGNYLGHLLERFDADVIPHKPRNVLVMCGTNDAYRLPTVQQFQDQAAILREKIRAIGARPVFWDCSVCDKNYVDGDRLIPSRVLAIGTDYNGPAPYPTA
ncbi:hypothetical protein VCS63_21000 [Achromobacter sp. D10]|uniref:SGNH/GDSL hydrolase family protein n=1 Tax=Achromobacter sp. D10 TaxID=3110765 RepID=UPI002B4751C1|nr:hypothetical protein [Achromobacter sp. D10]MEB3098334.1 hypothetical protein [Achromobacter sp. D10]